MADDRDQERPDAPAEERPRVLPPGWTEADAALEERIAEEEQEVRTNRKLVIAALFLIALVVSALVLGLIGVSRDIEAVAKATPKEDSVGTASIQAGAVTSDKLAPEAVGTDQLADGAVTGAKVAAGAIGERALADGAVSGPKLAEGAVGASALARGAVTNPALANDSVGGAKLREGSVDASKVVADSLTGAQIRESTLGKVPLAAEADDAARLGGLAASEFLSSVEIVTGQTDETQQAVKGPLGVECPSGTVVIGGGARVLGVDAGVVLSASAPAGTTGWVAKAEEVRDLGSPWRLVVYAVCASSG